MDFSGSFGFSSFRLTKLITGQVIRSYWTSLRKQARCIINLRMPIPILSTKLYIPPARANGVSRPRLIQKLLTGLDQPGSFALLSGPAGFGKTTLLSEFMAALQQPVAWVSFDAGDDDPIQFWSYVIAACQSIEPEVGESALSLLELPQALPGRDGTVHPD